MVFSFLCCCSSATVTPFEPLTVEVVREWAANFDNLLKSQRGQEEFLKYLKKEHSECNFLFWQSCEQLRVQTNQGTVNEMIRTIYHDFLAPEADMQININAANQGIAREALEHPAPHAFDPVQQEIYGLMKRDSYGRYIRSYRYKELLASFEPEATNSVTN
ncbi:hypothetical protein L5515_009790 [Caenorhabditis briggsae]|uniref:RGS domain-containing protein n=1 Tax=Caenorhabditis briggsae TaxID=6238 RepID=A0AAE9F9S1_CAEBR|nr:hypothetical protein L5515_009790 [Caenorhabditis briggsae]